MSGAQLYLGPQGDYLSRWKRIHYLDARLRDGSAPGGPELAGACGVSLKTIYRDIEAMRVELGAPIVYDRERRGYRYSRAGFQVPAASLSERDLFALMVAEQAVAQYGATPLGDELRGAFTKMLAALPEDLRARHVLAARAIHFSGLPPTPIASRLWSTLVEGILTRRRLTIEYFAPARGRVDPRRIEPYLLVARDREWFLVGRTETNRHDALFYVPRIRRATLERGHYEVDPDFSPERYYEHGFNAMHGSGPVQRIELLFAPAHAHLAEERPWSPDQEIVRRRDGSLSVRFRSNALFEIERQVLRYGGAVTVLAPRALREAVAQAAAGVLRAHQGPA